MKFESIVKIYKQLLKTILDFRVLRTTKYYNFLRKKCKYIVIYMFVKWKELHQNIEVDILKHYY